ncbi:MAG: ABC transporter ATP-binding protein [Sulfurospirillum sp.]
MPLIEAEDISHSFDYPLFDDINFSLDESESMSITGVSGSGKSTLMHICSTILQPNSGTIKLFGEDIYSLSQKELIKIRRERVGIIFQAHYLFRGLSAYENLELSTVLTGNRIDDGLIEKFKIEKTMNQKIGELSGGQQQRVSIARVLTKRPKIIFADEPTGNLDEKTANEVMDILFEYIKDIKGVLFLVTHEKELAKRCKYSRDLSIKGLL